MHSDVTIARKYTQKHQRAKDLGHQFEIPFSSFKRMRNRKTCELTKVKMNLENSTIDRIDNRKGYLVGNVAGVRSDMNRLKGTIESVIGNTPDVDWYTIQRLVNNTIERIERGK